LTNSLLTTRCVLKNSNLPPKNTKESINSDLRRKVDDDHKRQVRKPKPIQKGVAKNSTPKKPKEPAEIDEDSFILVTGKNAARRPQQQIQPQQAARGHPAAQYDALSSDEDDKDEESKSDEDEESMSKEDDNNNKKETRTQ
jgi:hypothetical protein